MGGIFLHYFHFHQPDGELLCSLLFHPSDMSQNSGKRGQSGSSTNYGTTVVELAKRPDGTWEATQTGLDVVGTGESAPRATEDMARTIAELQKADEL